MSGIRRVVAFALASVLAVGATACASNDDPAPVVAESGGEPAEVRVPSQIVGLSVAYEEIPTERVADVERPYVDSVAVFSLREEELLRATLQVTRLSGEARPQSPSFRRRIVEQLGTVRPIELHVGGTSVYSTAGTEQEVYVWFEGRGMYVLSVQQDFPFPRTLLRRLMDKDLSV